MNLNGKLKTKSTRKSRAQLPKMTAELLVENDRILEFGKILEKRFREQSNLKFESGRQVYAGLAAFGVTYRLLILARVNSGKVRVNQASIRAVAGIEKVGKKAANTMGSIWPDKDELDSFTEQFNWNQTDFSCF